MTSSSYNWALHLEATHVQIADLSKAARRGYGYAYELAEDALERSRDPRRHEQLEPLTLQQLADEEGLQPAQLARLITLARRQLFGNLSDAAIYKRRQRQHGRTPRPCAHPNCTTTIPVTAPANKQYCDWHATGAARVRRHRQHNTKRQRVLATPAKTHASPGRREERRPLTRLRSVRGLGVVSEASSRNRTPLGVAARYRGRRLRQ